MRSHNLQLFFLGLEVFLINFLAVSFSHRFQLRKIHNLRPLRHIRLAMSDLKEEALLYHEQPPRGKIGMYATKPLKNQRDLALAYTPGVAEPCRAIAQNRQRVFDYTTKGNLVAVITNGSAVLGLGNIGPEASKPVMEGKAVLFKSLAGINAFDIELDSTDAQEIISIVKALGPTFGGINLEDIKAPECFEIEEEVKKHLQIPVMHDDQHGTAIITGAALLNSLEIAKKDIKDVQIVVNGAGAGAIACSKLYLELGVQKKNIVMCDSKGVIHNGRTDINVYKRQFATDRLIYSMKEALKGADMFLGLSKADVLEPSHLISMARDPIVFALSNPDPEISYHVARATRDDLILATGRSDYPNQVNNVLGYPYIFRGALDVRATEINEAMKLAAVKAVAGLAKTSTQLFESRALENRPQVFGRDYILPKATDPRLIIDVSTAVAKAAMESGVAQKPVEDWNKYRAELQNLFNT